LRAAYALGIAASLVVLAYLNAVDLIAQWEAEANISRMSQVFEEADEPTRLEYERQAELYNARLAGADVDEDPLPYAEQLLYREEPMMSYLEIAKIALKLPIYHGTQENVLMAGVGHLETSALPVGGKGCRCVLLGHSGMRNARMFDDLELLRAGDAFTVWTLNEPYAYRVFRTEVVKPQDVEAHIEPEPGRDLATLITCTPYGVNSHRLLVHAERCAYEAAAQPEPDARTYVNRRSAPLLAALALLVTAAAALALHRARAAKAARRMKMIMEEG
jgi:sortase A